MAFPQVSSVTGTGFPTRQATHAVNMPATVDAGDLLMVFISTRVATGAFTPTDWTQLALETGPSNSSGIYIKVAVGNEDGGTVDFNGSSAEGAADCYRITAWGGTTSDVEVSTVVSAVGATADPASLTPSWGAKDNLWLIFVGMANDEELMTGAPTNYGNIENQISGAGENLSASVGSCRRELNATTEDPGAATIDFASYHAWTVAVEPAGVPAAEPFIEFGRNRNDNNLLRM